MEKTILYINNEYCLSLKQLKAYFAKPLLPESSLFTELLTLQSDGLLAKWLGESGDEHELQLARELDAIPPRMADSDTDLMNELKRIFTGSHEGVTKPEPSQFLELTAIKCMANDKEVTLSTDGPSVYEGHIQLMKDEISKERMAAVFSLNFSFKIMKKVNEQYAVNLELNDGTRLVVGTLSPNQHRVGATVTIAAPVVFVNVHNQEDYVLTVDGKTWATVKLAVNLLPFMVKGVKFKMVFVEGGTFTMGATPEQDSDAKSNERPAHEVTLSDYYIGQTQVTQELWQAVMGSNPSLHTGDLQYPVEMVNWFDCQTFIDRLNKLLKDQLDGRKFHLPAEAQWEYAARGGRWGNGYKYAGSEVLDDVAWIDCRAIYPVATKTPNELGLYDMSGNVWEWCEDYYGGYSSAAQKNPTGPAGSNRVQRGGSWRSFNSCCRVSYRSDRSPGFKYDNIGLRLALTPFSKVYDNKERMAFMEMNYHYKELETHILERIKRRMT